jgi:hypothetical protein
VMQAVAEDTMFGPFLSFVTRGTVRNNPVSAVVATFLLVEVMTLCKVCSCPLWPEEQSGTILSQPWWPPSYL